MSNGEEYMVAARNKGDLAVAAFGRAAYELVASDKGEGAVVHVV